MMQSVTQIQEVTLSFVPKLVGVALVILLSGQWMLDQSVDFTHAAVRGAAPAALRVSR